MSKALWEKVTHTVNNWIADIPGGRLYVKARRTALKTHFDGFYNGRELGSWSSVDEAKEALEKLWKAGNL